MRIELQMNKSPHTHIYRDKSFKNSYQNRACHMFTQKSRVMKNWNKESHKNRHKNPMRIMFK